MWSFKKDDRPTTIWYWSLNWQTDLFVGTKGTTFIGLSCFTNPSCRLKTVSTRLIDWQRSVREKLACRLAQNPWLSPRPVQLLLKRMNRFVKILSCSCFHHLWSEGKLDKIQKNSSFFSWRLPLVYVGVCRCMSVYGTHTVCRLGGAPAPL